MQMEQSERRLCALLLDNLSGMAAVSFTQKAMSSGMLSADEGRLVLAIVQMALLVIQRAH